MRVLDARQMREADRRTIALHGLSGADLMECAGAEVACVVASVIGAGPGGRVSILCGRGNNGGDGFVAARRLLESTPDVAAYLIGADESAVTGDARLALEALLRSNGRVVIVRDEHTWRSVADTVRQSDVIVDALVGTGLNSPLSGLLADLVRDVNAWGRPVVSVDVPSGLFADGGAPQGPVVQATVTVTLAAPKLALLQSPGEQLAGRLVIADIGIPAEVIDGLDGPRIELATRDLARRVLQPRTSLAHKGDFGHVLIVAGSPGKTGAAALAGMAALRSGAGLVTVATPASCRDVVASFAPEYMTLGLSEEADGTVSAAAAEAIRTFGADVVALGPGLGRTPGVRALVEKVLTSSEVPLVLDADAIAAFAGARDRLQSSPGRTVVVTPHPGEMAALLGVTTADVQARRIDVARDLATSAGLHVVLKGHRTVTAAPDGRVWINDTGNPGMATGGTGDVLTGAMAAWLVQIDDPAHAAALAVYLHGRAGDLARDDQGETGLIAGDVVDRLARAARDLPGSPEPFRR